MTKAPVLAPILVLILTLPSCGAAEREPAHTDTSPASVAASASAAAIEPALEAPEAPLPSPAPAMPKPQAGLELPKRFTALGTEPFWAAKANGDQLTYSTPDDQAGQTIRITRTASADSVEVAGTLSGQPLVFTITAGPCSDGMSDRVYPLSVRRRLGDDEQRGCARPS